jgi:hypothetical protein
LSTFSLKRVLPAVTDLFALPEGLLLLPEDIFLAPERLLSPAEGPFALLARVLTGGAKAFKTPVMPLDRFNSALADGVMVMPKPCRATFAVAVLASFSVGNSPAARKVLPLARTL